MQSRKIQLQLDVETIELSQKPVSYVVVLYIIIYT